MNGLALGMLGLLLLPTPASAQYAAPPVGTWAQLPKTSVYPAQPFEAKSESAPGSTPELWSPQSLFAYSGADVAQRDGVWGFLIWGGGHAATPDNSLYWVPFDGSGATRLTGPYLAPDKVYSYDDPLETYRSVSRNAPPTVTVAAAPKSRHTYSSLLRIDVNGRPAMFNYGGSLRVGSGSGTAATRVFDLSQTYTQAMARPDMGWALKAPAPGSAVASSSGWDPVQKRVVTRSRSFIGAYYPNPDRWENWNIQGFPGGGDNQSGVAMDVVGRKMYVLGDKLAEMIDLDTKVWTDLRGKPWAAATGNALGWHARTRQIVSWWGGQNLTLINPATNTIKSVIMGGAAVTPKLDSGTYGRFRVIPGTDQVVLVNAVDQNVFIGTVPFDGVQSTPTPTPRSTPSSTPTPVPTTNRAPRAYLDSLVAGVVSGWAADPDRPAQALQVVVVVDGADVATVAADQPRPDVRAAFPQFTGNHGLVYTLPAKFQDGRGHQLRLFAIDDDGSRVEFDGSNLTFPKPVAQVPTPPPPLPPSPSPPPPSLPSAGVIRVPAGQPIPARQWVERPMPTQGQAYMAGAGGKHGRAFYHPGLKAMIFAGGDWHTSQPQYDGPYADGTGSEIWSLDVLNDKWTLQRPFCVPGESQPGHPDTVGWAYDSKRDRGLMTPGFYFITQGAVSQCGSADGLGAYAFSFATKKFTGPDAVAGMPPPPSGWGGDLGASYGIYNPTLDEYLRVRTGPMLERLRLSSQTWGVQNLSNGHSNWNPGPNRAQPVLDVQGQALYWLDVWSSPRALIKIALANGALTSIPLPASYVPPSGRDHEVFLAFDPQSRTILIPNNVDMGQSPLAGLGLYHVDAGQWEWEPVPAAVVGSVWGFDEATGALLGIGKRVRPSAYFLYHYSATRQPTSRSPSR